MLSNLWRLFLIASIEFNHPNLLNDPFLLLFLRLGFPLWVSSMSSIARDCEPYPFVTGDLECFLVAIRKFPCLPPLGVYFLGSRFPILFAILEANFARTSTTPILASLSCPLHLDRWNCIVTGRCPRQSDCTRSLAFAISLSLRRREMAGICSTRRLGPLCSQFQHVSSSRAST